MHGHLNPSILGNDLRNARCDQQQRLAIVPTSHERDSLPLKTGHLPIRQDRLQSVTDLNASTMVVDGIQNQHSAIFGFAPDSPLMEKIDGVTLNVSAIERMDGYHRNLGMRFFVDLAADVIHLRDRVLIQDVRKIVDIVRGFELRDGFRLRC